MTWDPVRDPIPMNMRDPVVPGSAIPVEVAFTMRRTPRDEMTTGGAEAYARGRADALAWRPIETAPRDGARALVWSAEGGHRVVERLVTGWWDGWAEDWLHPTHWMALPPPPKHARAGAPEAADGAGGMGGSPDAPDAASGPHSHRDGGV